LDDIAALQPDLVLVPSEPYAFTDDHLDELAASIPGASIVRIDGQDLFWWGARTPGAIERLAVTV
jgi:ABC-type hemin transport system substrate-binding protein